LRRREDAARDVELERCSARGLACEVFDDALLERQRQHSVAKQLSKKMPAIDGAITQRMPKAASIVAAVSRELPQAKFGPRSELRVAKWPLVQDERQLVACIVEAAVAEEIVREFVLRSLTALARRPSIHGRAARSYRC